ncbi:hypothetical protein Ocin01_02608 [Orchesella cincta]|uniref:Uncharacterized protein n=1 Tax=Orchesella cincta TaxID=48709 RepID=A0A1D2NFL2_ORCCI|nr:hypothetical protein Ocin01_02608 [Orchesella cincta]
MLLKTYLAVCMALLCHASKLTNPTNGSPLSPTISVQRVSGGRVYNFVKEASALPQNAGKPVSRGSGRRFGDDTDEVVFSEDGEDAAVTVPTTPELPSTPETDLEENDATVPTVNTENPLTPSDGISENEQDAEDSATLPEAPTDVTAPSVPEPPPAEAVPGQPIDAPDSSSSSSSASSEYSSSSSSEEYRYKEAFKKAWEHKIKNELNLNRSSKSKDVLARLYSPLSKTSKDRFSKRL